MLNSTVSRAQVRSISIETDAEPDKWVHHVARYEYRVAIAFTDTADATTAAATPDLQGESIAPVTQPLEEEREEAEESEGSDSSDSD